MSIDNSDDLTVDELTKEKEDIFSETGLQNTALGRAVEKKREAEAEQANKRAEVVRKKILVQAAEEQGLGDDPDVEALRADVTDMSEEIEAAALVARHEREEAEIQEKIDNLENLAERARQQNQDRLAANYKQRVANLKAEHDIEDEPKSAVEALIAQPDEEPIEEEHAEALAKFREKREVRDADDELPPSAQKILYNLKNMREQARQQGNDRLEEKYDDKIEALRAEHA